MTGLLTGCSQRCHVRARDAAVDEECRRVDEARLVAGEEQHSVRDLLRLGEPAGRNVDEAALRTLGVLREELTEQRRIDRSRAECVDPDALARELHAEL